MLIPARSNDKQFLGVCAGLAEANGWDVGTTRLITALLMIPTGGQIFWAYLIAYLIMPAADGRAVIDDVTKNVRETWETEVKPHFSNNDTLHNKDDLR